VMMRGQSPRVRVRLLSLKIIRPVRPVLRTSPHRHPLLSPTMLLLPLHRHPISQRSPRCPLRLAILQSTSIALRRSPVFME
jgi:hypothetical protein